MKWIELPQMKDMTDLIRVANFISKRHFDKILVYVDLYDLKDKENYFLMLHQIEFFGHVFGQDVLNSIGVYFKNSTGLPNDIILMLEKVIPASDLVSRYAKVQL